jgi:hypothetical protein
MSGKLTNTAASWKLVTFVDIVTHVDSSASVKPPSSQMSVCGARVIILITSVPPEANRSIIFSQISKTVGANDGTTVGREEGLLVGEHDGTIDGKFEGEDVGDMLG